MTVRPSSSSPRAAARAITGRGRASARGCRSARGGRRGGRRRSTPRRPGERVGLAVGDHAAAREHDDAVGQQLRLLHVVRGEQDRGAALAQAADQLPRLAARGRVEAGRRLVEEQQVGVAGDAEREVEAAALAAGQRRGTRVGAVVEPDELEHLVDRARVRIGGGVELDRLAHGEVGVEARLLQHDADALEEGALAPRGVVAEHADGAGVGRAMALEDLDERGLAGAVGPEQREQLAAARR